MDPTNQIPTPNPNPAPPVTPPAAPATPETAPAGVTAAPAITPPAAPVAVVAGGSDNQPPQSSPAASNSAMGDYVSNPFLNAVRGLVLTLSTNPGPALLSTFTTLLFIAVAYAIALLLVMTAPAAGAVAFIVVGILGLWATGAFYVIGGASARSETITLGRAYGVSLKKLLPYIGLTIISMVMVAVGFILLIVPGIILIARLSLAPIVLFEENLGPIAAIKRSFSLTKGHVNEMLGALFAGSLIGETYYSLLFGAISVSPLVGRYHDLRQLQESGAAKPKTHWLNYLYLLGPVILGLIIVLIAIPAIHNAGKKSDTPTFTTTNSSSTTDTNFDGTTFGQ